jgi:glycosyltransferase involved in cell wall biosynthesis
MEGSPWGGSEELWSQAASRLTAEGHEVIASTCHWNPTPPQIVNLLRAGVTVKSRRETNFARVSRIGQRLLGAESRIIAAKRRVAWLRKAAAELICVSNGGIGDSLDWALACRNQGTPYALLAESNADQFWPDDNIATQLAEAYSGARACFFVSKRNLDRFEEQIGARLPHARIVRNPVNVRYHAAPPWPYDQGIWRLACVARLEPAAKGQDILIKILSQPRWRERPLRVVLYGTGRCERSIRNLCDLHGVRSIEFAGHVADVERIWAENHALVLASRYEGLPLALVEAMLCSRTAIVTDVAGNAEVIEAGVTGFIAKAPTVSLVDAAMEEAWLHREQWRKMGARAGEAIRRLLPEDPVGEFCEQLLAIV